MPHSPISPQVCKALSLEVFQVFSFGWEGNSSLRITLLPIRAPRAFPGVLLGLKKLKKKKKRNLIGF